MSAPPRPRLLLVEDDENDVLFFQRALRGCGAQVDLEIVRDGAAALRRLAEGQLLPDRIVLDLKLPRVSGLEVLLGIRSNPLLKLLSVTILTSSGEPSDLARIRELGIDEYIVKPVSYQGLLEIVRSLCKKWDVKTATSIMGPR